MWLPTFRRYLIFTAIANLIWEFAQLPLYTIWYQGTSGEIVFAALHCTGGDILIGSVSLLAALFLFGHHEWPSERYLVVAAAAIIFGLSYTVFSEWLNTSIRGSWAYAERMPTLPMLGVGLSPLAQWVIVPLAAFWWARSRRAG